MKKKTKTIIITIIIIFLFILNIIYFLFIKPPYIVDVDWKSSKVINIEHTPLWVRALKIEDTDYIFYSAKEIDDDNISIFYISKNNTEYSEPSLIDLNLPIYHFFNCFYDEEENEIYIFFCHHNNSGYALYSTKGRLNVFEPVKRITEFPGPGNYGMGVMECSAFKAKDGKIYLFYCWITGQTENINELFLTKFDGNNWSEPEYIGIGNSPCAIQDKNGRIYLYSNLWTLTYEVQYCVDEWKYENNKWKKNKITTSAEDDNVDPFVIENEDGTKFLLYAHKKYKSGTKTNLLIQSKRKGESWSNFLTIVKGKTKHGIKSPCAIVDNNIISVYYIQDDNLCFKSGKIKE